MWQLDHEGGECQCPGEGGGERRLVLIPLFCFGSTCPALPPAPSNLGPIEQRIVSHTRRERDNGKYEKATISIIEM